MRSDTYIDDMRSSTFCICPEGWHAWSPRPFYAILQNCIPVIMSDELEMPYEEIVCSVCSVCIRDFILARLCGLSVSL